MDVGTGPYRRARAAGPYTAVLAQMALPETSDAALSLIGSKFADQATGETVAQFFVRLKRAYTDCRSALDRLGCRRLLPHPDTLVPLVFQRTRVEYSTEVRDILRMSKLTEADLSLDLVCETYSAAAARVVKTFPALDAAINEAKARAAKPKPKPDRDRDRDRDRDKSRDKERDKGRGRDRGRRNDDAPAPPRDPARGQANQPAPAPQQGYLPNPSLDLEYSRSRWLAEGK